MDKKYERYDKVLNISEIIEYALMIDKFEEGSIDFKRLQALFLNNNVSLTVEPYKISETVNKEKRKEIKERYINGNYLPSDILNYIINGHIIFNIDYKVIELLANAGVVKYQTLFLSILKSQLRDSNIYSNILEEKINKLESKVSLNSKMYIMK